VPEAVQTVTYPLRMAVRVVLLDDRDELLLMYMDDPAITAIGGTNSGRFWTLVGGEIERDETIREAAVREVYEETGLTEADVELGPHAIPVGYGSIFPR
jgi:8-oxo-dGTP pyrophosphatase MutT (NUDIX family)